MGCHKSRRASAGNFTVVPIRAFWFLEKVETLLVGTEYCEEYMHLWTTRESKTWSFIFASIVLWFFQLFIYPQSTLHASKLILWENVSQQSGLVTVYVHCTLLPESKRQHAKIWQIGSLISPPSFKGALPATQVNDWSCLVCMGFLHSVLYIS